MSTTPHTSVELADVLAGLLTQDRDTTLDSIESYGDSTFDVALTGQGTFRVQVYKVESSTDDDIDPTLDWSAEGSRARLQGQSR